MILVKNLIFLVFLLSGAAQAQTVCTATLNSSDEKELFAKKLIPQGFNFIELTDYNSEKSNDWFERACEAKVQCDILIVSGHFGGNFFGHTPFTLNLKSLETQSCQNRCAGILDKPREVFLFGCNTLASKEKDHRSPQDYLNALMEHYIPRADAERIVTARYSPMGSSYQERMQRIFEHVPMIYGFSSVSPLGKNVRPALQKYLNEVGDYKKHLQTELDTSAYRKAMGMYAIRLAPGKPKDDVKENSCRLLDQGIPLETRVRAAGDMLKSSPFTYFPIVTNFMGHEFNGVAIEDQTQTNSVRLELKRLYDRNDLKSEMLQINETKGFGISLQIDLYKFSRSIGWYSEQEYNKKTRALLINLIRKPDIFNANLICSLTQEKNSVPLFPVTMEDLVLPETFQTFYGLQMFQCLRTQDKRLTEMYLKTAEFFLKNRPTVLERLIVLRTLGQLPGYRKEISDLIFMQPLKVRSELSHEYETLIQELRTQFR